MSLVVFMAPTAFSQSEPAPLAFEVVSVKPLQGVIYRNDISISGNRVTASGPVKHLIEMAYRTKDYEIFGGPDWTASGDVLYDIAAKAEGDKPPTMDQARRMLQTLLADRFQLKLHKEPKEISIYALVVNKTGPKLKQSATNAKFDMSLDMGPKSRMSATMSMASLAGQLTNLVTERPVVDKTGLTGLYDFTLEWAPDDAPTDVTEGPSIFTAVQEQLGLKLESTKAPVEVLVIDHVERPSAN